MNHICMIYPMIDAHAIQSTYLLYIAAEAEITLRSGPLARPGIGIIGIFRIPPPYRTHYSSPFIHSISCIHVPSLSRTLRYIIVVNVCYIQGGKHDLGSWGN